MVSCTWKEKWNRRPMAERERLKARQRVRTVGMMEIDGSGENLSSVEVESILYRHPTMVEAAGVARPHEY